MSKYMLNIHWIKIKYLNVPWIQINICLIYLEITKLQLILLLIEYEGMFLDEKSNNLVNMDGHAIL
jgi:hypothetical protein